ncbi:hypothetical protein OF83DRAFT_1104307 [Amylostereum chailletii]|nr:hypothetical protein OF83DRAFT_1104307 [Amylostereum chailletii]
MRIEEGFQQTPFSDNRPYGADPVLPGLLKRLLPPVVYSEVEPDLKRFEKKIVTNIRALSDEMYPPTVKQYNQWGQRIDDLHTSEGWRGMRTVCQQEGIVALSYERAHGEYSRIHAFAKILMLTGDGNVIFCPLSMTDGCARALELHGTPAMKKDVYPRLISRDPAMAFTSGQWMTERPGGSDVSQTETVATLSVTATHPLGKPYKLDGFKWFSSATDSSVSLALARTGTHAQGSRGLSLFLVPLRLPLLRSPSDPLPSPTSNNIFIHRLKNKIGTQQGIKCIVPVLNITRIHSAIASIGSLRKALAIASSFATERRIAGGTQLLVDTPVHVAELAKISLTYRALSHLVFGAVHLLGKTECKTASDEETLRFRVLTPVVKGFAADKAVAAMEECMAALGGQGYMEENTVWARLIRDALVEKIWEGTITVLALDLLRSIQVPGVLDSFMNWARQVLVNVPPALRKETEASLSVLSTALEEIPSAYKKHFPSLASRPAFMLVSQVTSSLYLLEHASWSYANHETGNRTDVEAFRRWVAEAGLQEAQRDLHRALADAPGQRSQDDLALVYGPRSKSKL